ncbi:uncharacterized protein LOC127844307 isoform X3 [Dreissena polymorpha]|nr:uncharacterized protein LOC127844307 isoform X3 [Dreissena polymorpha]KAH3777174.1 hypothetical protein DPMN_178610 [Dreissena polymorpha]
MMKSFRALYGYNYVQNGWMGDIYSCTSNGVYFLKSTISPSQPGIGRNDYDAWVAVSSDSTVLTGHCTCPAGKGRTCSHISAIIYAVTTAWTHGVGGKTCTDEQVAWGKGASKVLCHDKLSDIEFKKPGAFDTPTLDKPSKCDLPLPPFRQLVDHSDLQKHVESSSSKTIWDCKQTLLYKVLHAPERTAGMNRTEVNETSHGNHNVDSTKPVSGSLSCPQCDVTFQKYVCLDNEKVKSIQQKTEAQNSDMWIDSRKFRITSSRVHALPKTGRADPNKFVVGQLYNRFKGSVATRHGQKFEPVARQWFEKTSGQTVNRCGLVICQQEPYIAASPDGLIDSDTIVEIKCPTKPLYDLVMSGKYDVVLKEEKPYLDPKGKNGYYTQVQVAMYCTKASLCKFIVWTNEYQIVTDVPFDEEFVMLLLPRIRKFYFEHLLVRLSEELRSNRLQLSSEYKELCK